MKILAFSDTHGNLDKLKKIENKSKQADILICCGDLTVFEDRMNSLLEQVNNINKTVLMIHGNHEAEESLRASCKKYKNIFFLHKNKTEFMGHIFMGFGGGGFGQIDKDFESYANEISNSIENKKIILITHGPPHKTKVDNLNGTHVGNKSYSEFIKKYKPLLYFCGHIHETAGITDIKGETIITNPGPDGVLIEI